LLLGFFNFVRRRKTLVSYRKTRPSSFKITLSHKEKNPARIRCLLFFKVEEKKIALHGKNRFFSFNSTAYGKPQPFH
jgi:hypothetical protein